MQRIVITLTFDSSPIKGEGCVWLIYLVFGPHPVDTALCQYGEPCGFPLSLGMTGTGRRPVDSGSSPE